MARPVKKAPETWRKEILEAAKTLFLTKGYQETSVADIMKLAGGAKGLFYSFFPSKEELMCVLGEQLFLENNPFWAVQGREDLTALEKVREVMRADRADQERNRLSRQAVSILRDPAILMAAVDANRRILTPLWRELLEEGQRDGSIQTRYARELSELLPLVNFWLLPSVFPAGAEEIRHKCRFVAEVLAAMGLPIIEDEMVGRTEKLLGGCREERKE